MNLEEKIQSKETKTEEDSSIIDNLNLAIDKKIEEVKKELEAINEIKVIRDVYTNEIKSKRGSWTRYLTNMIYQALDKVKNQKEPYSKIEEIKPIYHSSDEKIKKERVELAERTIMNIYSSLSEIKYTASTEVNSESLRTEKNFIKNKILNNFRDEGIEIDTLHLNYAEEWASDLYLSQVYGREYVVKMMINNIEKITPNDTITPKLESLLERLKDK